MLQALALGLAGLGTHPGALPVAAVATWLAARRWLPPPSVGPGGELARWWLALGLGERLLLGAVGGAFAAWTVWLLRYPALGHDMVLYHLPEAIAWVHNGTPGSIEPIINGLPVGSYPLTHEVLLSWAMGISRSFVPATLLTAAFVVLLGVAGWLGMRSMGARRTGSGLAVAALVSIPAVTAWQGGGATLDPAALAWLASCAALCAASVRRPALLVPALAAGGLAVGTKTTALPLTALALTAAVVANRRALHGLRAPLALGAIAALAVGGFWYARNLVDHGSPFWPFLSAPWGDPRPPLVERADISFLDRPGETLSRLDRYYLENFGAGIVLLAGGLAAPLLARRWSVTILAVAVAGSILLWTSAPFTGVTDQRAFDVGTGDATRYLLPGVAAGALALALVSREGGRRGAAGSLMLGVALAVGLWNLAGLEFPRVPSAFTPLAGAALGALATLVAWRVRVRMPRPPPRPFLRAALATALVAGVAATGAVPASGYVERHASTGLQDAGIARWLAGQRAWREGSHSIAITSILVAPLAGDRLQHDLSLVGVPEACNRLRSGSGDGWIVVDRSGLLDRAGPVRRARGRCAARAPSYEDPHYRAYRNPPSAGDARSGGVRARGG